VHSPPEFAVARSSGSSKARLCIDRRRDFDHVERGRTVAKYPRDATICHDVDGTMQKLGKPGADGNLQNRIHLDLTVHSMVYEHTAERNLLAQDLLPDNVRNGIEIELRERKLDDSPCVLSNEYNLAAVGRTVDPARKNPDVDRSAMKSLHHYGHVVVVDEEGLVWLRRARVRNMLDRHSERLRLGEEGGAFAPFADRVHVE